MKAVLSGNEAIARGAYEAGVRVATAYPGTPSTEILENIVKYKEIYAEWSPNEKVALEVATGAAIAGVRALAAMKHVGVNVAADPLFTVSYTGIKGGFVIVTADDPAMHSSQNEQDSRQYARFAKIPMLEPSDSQEAKDFLKKAYEISEAYDTPVFLRSSTRISHAKSIVALEEPATPNLPEVPEKEPQKYVMLPGNARKRRPLVEERMDRLTAYADEYEGNVLELRDRAVGIVAAGACYAYAKEVFPDASFLKLGMSYPLPEKKIREIAAHVERLYVFEELDPFFEEQIRAMGISVTGKKVFPRYGEFGPETAENGIAGKKERAEKPLLEYLPPRPPNMCPGCPHRGVFYVLKKMKVYVTGDIGCYTLGALPPLEALDTCICMGASIGHAMGMDKALGEKGRGKVVAAIGDSTFLHSGITGLLDIAYNKGDCTVIIFDNRTTAMTGRQEHPGTGYTLGGEPTKSINYHALCGALGIDRVVSLNPYDLKETRAIITEQLALPGSAVILSEGPCVLHKRDKTAGAAPFMVNEAECKSCKACLQLGCPALEWHVTGESDGIARINQALCTGCSLCAQVCPTGAIDNGKQ